LRSASSTTVSWKEADVCPAGTVTVAGTVALDVALDASVISVSATGAEGRVTVPFTGAAPSVAVAAVRLRRMGRTSNETGSELMPLAITDTE
jgi:hypothetical protein